MKPYLVFRLYGPLASWGLPAVGGERQSAVSPSRSAILGLLGAALGIKREDEQGLLALQQSVAIAVKQTVPTTLLRDYHTTQVPSHSSKVIHSSRKSELSEAKLNTILSSRDYRCDGLWVIAVSLTKQATFDLAALQAALLKPVYALSLGRKSCPLALPMMPTITESCGLKQALDTCFPPLTATEKSDHFWLGSNDWVSYFWEGDKQEIEGSVTTSYPWDEPESRNRWQFRQRAMHQLSVPFDNK